MRLWAATGDAVARLDEDGGRWTVALSLQGSGAQCLSPDPRDPDTAYVGLREDGCCARRATAARRGGTSSCRSPASSPSRSAR